MLMSHVLPIWEDYSRLTLTKYFNVSGLCKETDIVVSAVLITIRKLQGMFFEIWLFPLKEISMQRYI